MHQDAWGKFIATPPAASCLPPLEPAIGWDGAPRWATITDGLTTCRLGIREVSPAAAQAFQSFWLDREGIQSALVRTWARLAREFAAEPAVAGYDLLNEPNPGFTVGATELTLLLPSIREYARQEDAHVIGGAWWSWKQACGDPHVVGTPGGEPTGISPSLNRYQCPEQELLGIPRGTRQVLSRAYPRAAPGRIVSLRSDPATGAFRLVGRDSDRAGGCRLRVWAPGRGRPAFDAEGVRDLRERRVPGGWLVAGCASGRYELRRTG